MGEQLRLFKQPDRLEPDDFCPGSEEPNDTYYYYNSFDEPRGQRRLWLGALAYNGEHVPEGLNVVALNPDNVIPLFPDDQAA